MHTTLLYLGVFALLQTVFNLAIGLLSPYSFYQYYKNFAFVIFGMLTLALPIIIMNLFKEYMDPNCHGRFCIHFPLPFMMGIWILGTPGIVVLQVILNYLISNLKLKLTGYKFRNEA
ncbi:MAG: hypothetical protein NTX03_00670 [Bacteroidetes bacterium]|nr:hypothetical protein [Bacteroidota bacterium]